MSAPSLRIARFSLSLALAASGLSAYTTGCACSCRSVASGETAAPRNVDVTRDQAIQRATDELRAQGRDPAIYDTTVHDRAHEWEVAFDHKPPRPPGGSLSIFVSKRNGSTRTMLGE